MSGDGDYEDDGRTQAAWFRIGGVMLIGADLAWMITDQLLRRFLPLRWGGPNIGGGFLLIVSYATVTAGVAVVVVSSMVSPPKWRAGTWTGLAVLAGMAAGYLVLRVI